METTILSKTGERCPKTGMWVALEDMNSSVFIEEGTEMPPFKGRSISWEIKDPRNL
jgi:hypothetical protein